MNELERIQFHGQELLAIREDAGRVLVPVKRICQNMGLDWSAQYRLINNDDVLRQSIVVTTTVTSRGNREMVCLPLDLVPGWLFQIPATRYPEEKRTLINLYRRECFKTLGDHFLKPAEPGVGRAEFQKFADTVTALIDVTRSQSELIGRFLDQLRESAPARPAAPKSAFVESPESQIPELSECAEFYKWAAENPLTYKILKLRKSGMMVKDVAAACGVCDRTVWRHSRKQVPGLVVTVREEA